MIDCDKLMERNDLRRVVNKKVVVTERTGKKERGVCKLSHSSRVLWLVHTRTSAALERGHYTDTQHSSDLYQRVSDCDQHGIRTHWQVSNLTL